jgi:hypothetical protein
LSRGFGVGSNGFEVGTGVLSATWTTGALAETRLGMNMADRRVPMKSAEMTFFLIMPTSAIEPKWNPEMARVQRL